MKKLLILVFLMWGSISAAFSQTKMAEIKFDQTSHDFGNFSVDNPVVRYVFVFTNVGDAPLVLHQAIASCGCTVPEYTKQPIKPGEKGQIAVTYNGQGRAIGRFKKSITIRSNAKTATTRLFITGNMTGSEKNK